MTLSFELPEIGANRRKRMIRTPSVAPVHLTDRDVVWLKALSRHGMLSSEYLHAFTRSKNRSPRATRYRLRQLFDNGYVGRPWQQQNSVAALSNMMIYGLAEAGRSALRDRGISDATKGPSGPWAHAVMVASITASIELAAKECGVGYIFQHEILSRAGADMAAGVQINYGGKPITTKLRPDALFGLEYQKDSQKAYRFYFVEADRGTEPHRSKSLARKSHLKTVLQYREFVGRGLYKQHFGLTANALVLNVTRSLTQMENMMDVVGEVCPDGNSYMLFQNASEFSGPSKPPSVLTCLLSDPWARAYLPSIGISRC